MRFLLTILLLFGALFASNYKVVVDKNLILGKDFIVNLKLLEEDYKDFASKGAIVKIRYIDNNFKEKEFTFSQNDKDDEASWPLFYFNNRKVVTNPKNSIINLVQGVTLIDLDNDGFKEIIVYGTSSYGGSGFIGKVLIIGKVRDSIKLKAPIIEAYDNFEILYFKEQNLIVVSQYIWRSGKEAHYGDKHRYFIDIYEVNNHYKKIPLMVTKKRYSDEGSSVILQLKRDILNKYALYKSSKISNAKKQQIINFVKEYWQRVANKDYKFIEDVFANRAFYYSKTFSKKMILKDKKRLLKRAKYIKFKLDRFLVYKINNSYIVEYRKYFKTSKRDGKVVSFMRLKEGLNGFKILSEKDLAILYLSTDI